MAKTSFDRLIDEIGLELQSGDRFEADGEIHPSDQAVLKTFQRVAAVLAAQASEMKEIRAELAALKTPGAEPMKKALTARDGAQINGASFLAKALEAQTAGRISGRDVATAEAYINAKKAPPAALVEAVLA